MLSDDEKLGIQATENKAPDLPPTHGKHATVGRDSEYIRHGTLSLLAGIDLVTGAVIDNHSAHTSKETRANLETVPNRFEFVFTPTHGSWLNIIESFFVKMTKSFLRHIRVNSKKELKTRIELYLKEVNENPVSFRWKYGMESASD